MPFITWTTQQWVALLGLSFAVFMVSLDVTVVVVSLPRIQADLGLSLSQLQWVVTAYSLVFAGFLLSAGVLADRYGRRYAFFIGLALFALASGAAGLANVAWLLNSARAVQGLGAALLMSSSGALLAQSFPGPDRTRAFGVWGTVVGIGLAFGPLIGGLITRHVGWHWVFLVNLPVAVLIFAAVWRSVPADHLTVRQPLDVMGMASFSGGLFAVIYALSTWQPGSDVSQGTVYAALAGALLFAAFAASQRLQRHPMIDVALLRDRAFVGITLMPVLLSISYWSLLVFLPQYFERSRGLDALGSGLAILPLTLPMLLLPPLGARLAFYLPRHVHFALAFALIWVGAAVMLFGLNASEWWMTLGMAVTGVGAGLINAQMTNVAVSVVAPERAGMATGINGSMRQAGFVLAIALHTVLIESAGTGEVLSNEAFISGFGRVLLAILVACAIAIVIGLTSLRARSPAALNRVRSLAG